MGRRKHSISFIREEFKERGYELISDYYENNRQRLSYKCKKHPDKISRMIYSDLKKGNRCRFCKYDEKRLTINAVREVLSDMGIYLISNEYENNTTPIQYECEAHPGIRQKGIFSNLQRRGCALCSRDRMSLNMQGSKHHNWKGGRLSPVEQARNSREYQLWRKNVFSRDNYTCACCGDDSGNNLEAHHIMNFSRYEQLRFDISNGITMCSKCHNCTNEGSFHNVYGTYNNNKGQLEEYFKTHNTFFKGVFSLENHLEGVLEKWRF